MNTSLRKPHWFKKKIRLDDGKELKRYLKDCSLPTVCQEALCPNIAECFSKKRATFLILGDICTRQCRFCNIKKGTPGQLQYDRIPRIREATLHMGLKHIVVTSVTRDDLTDGGAEYFAQTVQALKTIEGLTIELLIPDFKGDITALKIVAGSRPHIIGHNIETVPRLYPEIRPKADFKQSLRVIKTLKELNSGVHTKSGIMLGLGETIDEVIDCFVALRHVNCDFLSIGQYLRPSLEHAAVKEYIQPETFDQLRQIALEKGFTSVASGPYVRSSYMAESYLSVKSL